MRGDLVSRTNAFNQQIQCGIRSINEVRELENLPAVVGGDKVTQNAANKPIA